MVVMNVVYSIVSTPAGSLSDRMDRRIILAVGLGVLVLADIVLALVGTVFGALLGVALWGLHMGLTQGLLSTLVADTAPPELRGTAFGVFNLLGGLALLAASVVAGALWDGFGPKATFLAGAGFTVLALFGLWLVRLRLPKLGASHMG